MRNFSMLNFISANFEDNWILETLAVQWESWDNEIFSISDETDCKTASRALADLESSEWQGDKLYIILGEIYSRDNLREKG